MSADLHEKTQAEMRALCMDWPRKRESLAYCWFNDYSTVCNAGPTLLQV